MSDRVFVFDVNETLLSLAPVATAMAEVFGPTPPVGEWFARLLHGSLLVNAYGRYRDFDEIGLDALGMVAAAHGVAATRAELASVVATMRDLPPHPDVVPGLEGLRQAGNRVFALSNGSKSMLADQLSDLSLDAVFSCETVQRFKPDPVVYRHVADELGQDIGQLVMVASHDWDVIGARRAGMQGVYLERSPGRWSLPEERGPTVTAVGELLGGSLPH